jgi:hypothetical protein
VLKTVTLEKIIMDILYQSSPSAFAQIVDKLRNKSDEELKMLYLKFFANELNKEWEKITEEANFGGSTEDDIVKAIQKKRYNYQDV